MGRGYPRPKFDDSCEGLGISLGNGRKDYCATVVWLTDGTNESPRVRGVANDNQLPTMRSDIPSLKHDFETLRSRKTIRQSILCALVMITISLVRFSC